jgi:hypothetical protein
MTRESSMRLTMILAFVAAALALAAALIAYLRHDVVEIVPIAAGLFLVAFGLGARSRIPK